MKTNFFVLGKWLSREVPAMQEQGPEFEPTDPIGRKLWEQHALVTPELVRLRQEDSQSH